MKITVHPSPNKCRTMKTLSTRHPSRWGAHPAPIAHTSFFRPSPPPPSTSALPPPLTPQRCIAFSTPSPSRICLAGGGTDDGRTATRARRCRRCGPLAGLCAWTRPHVPPSSGSPSALQKTTRAGLFAAVAVTAAAGFLICDEPLMWLRRISSLIRGGGTSKLSEDSPGEESSKDDTLSTFNEWVLPDKEFDSLWERMNMIR